jgi:hypothetical protein
VYIPNINDSQVEKLFKILNKHQNPHIKTLRLQGGSLSNIGLAHFANMLVTIENVYLINHNLAGGAGPTIIQVFSL